MKLLMFNVKEFWYKTFSKTLEDVEKIEKEETIKNVIVVFANVEKGDEERMARIIRKTVKNMHACQFLFSFAIFILVMTNLRTLKKAFIFQA